MAESNGKRKKRAHHLSPNRGRMLRRRSEVLSLIGFRAEHRIAWTDLQGLADVVADIVFIAKGEADLLLLSPIIGGLVDEETILRACRRLDAVLDRVGGRYRSLTGAQAGRLLDLLAEERIFCGITTMRAIDESKEERRERVVEDRRQRDRERKRRERAGSVVQRPVYEAASKASNKPWEVLGMSRRTWYRRGQPSPEACGTCLSAAKIYITGVDRPVPRPTLGAEGPSHCISGTDPDRAERPATAEQSEAPREAPAKRLAG